MFIIDLIDFCLFIHKYEFTKMYYIFKQKQSVVNNIIIYFISILNIYITKIFILNLILIKIK